MSTTTNLGIELLEAEDVLKYVKINKALNILDLFVNLSVINQTTTSPPGSPSEGDAYIIGATATGDWTGRELEIALFSSGDWLYFPPVDSLFALDKSLGQWFRYDQSDLAWNLDRGKLYKSFSLYPTNFENLSGASSSTITLTNYNALAWVFTNGSDESINGPIVLPKHANFENVQVRLFCTSLSAFTGNLRFNLTFYNAEDGENLDSATSVTRSFTQTVSSGSANDLILATSGQFDLNSSVSEDSLLVLKIERESTHVDDTFDQDLNLLSVVIEYQEKSLFDGFWPV